MKNEIKNKVPENNNFIKDIVKNDLANDKYYKDKNIHTRFPPEPNGYLHIGHAKAICIDFGLAKEYGGICNLRMDDTNPVKESEMCVNSIKEDVKWLEFDWEDRFYCASDYFDFMYEFAVSLIKRDLAYVCSMTQEEVKENRGNTKTPAKSFYRDRPISESLDLFSRMKNGEFPDGALTLRAKIDLSSGNFNMRDPVIYRICHKNHHRTKDKWCIYPMYDFAHPIEDALEGITHSFCTLEFQDHRPLYNWVINHMENLKIKPKQIEFARLNITGTIMSKRKLKKLVDLKIVDGWDDPRMPTISGLRRRGYTPQAIKDFCERVGVSKAESIVDHRLLEHCLRNDLNLKAKRVMAVLDPVKLIIINYPDNMTERIKLQNNPKNVGDGCRLVDFSRELFIESKDFLQEKEKGFFRLYPGNKVRLMGSYIIECTGFDLDKTGKKVETVYAKYYPETFDANLDDGEKVKGTIHWVDAKESILATVNLYENLFLEDNVSSEKFEDEGILNPNSLKVLNKCRLEKSLEYAKVGENFQFVRNGYFCLDNKNAKDSKLVFNRSVGLKDGYKGQK